MEFVTQRALDHVVLPTGNLETARQRLERLGFTVAPAGKHPFGTENACVYFVDGTFLEPLAIYGEEQQNVAIRAGNVFVSRDRAYRYRCGTEGFSAVVFSTGDATADHARMRANGISAGDILDFSRDFVAADGAKDKASFRLAFASDPRAPDIFFFTCQRLNVPAVDRSALENHRNGATRIKAVVLSAPQARDFVDVVSLCAGSVPSADSREGRTRLALTNSILELLNENEFADFFGSPAAGDVGLQARAIVFGVRAIDPVQALLESNSVGFRVGAGGLIVDPAPGQGTLFVFEVDHEQT